jgi:phospholipid transport system substrate-binding protein
MLRRLVLSVCVLLCSATSFSRAAEVATDSPTATISALQQGLITAASQPGATIEQRYTALEPIVVATHNLPYIAEFALRRQWESLAEEDRARFIAAFQRLSVMTYAARFKAVGANTFRPITAAPADAGGRVQVSTAVARADQPDVSLEYVLQQDGASWRIINIVADGVSDLALKRAEYQRLFSGAGVDGLVADLEAQTAQLARN